MLAAMPNFLWVDGASASPDLPGRTKSEFQLPHQVRRWFARNVSK